MKTLEEFYNEVTASDELKKAFVDAIRNNSVEDFLKANGCDATLEETDEFLAEKAQDPEPLSLDDIEKVAGGSLSPVSGTCSVGETCGDSVTCIVNCC